MSADTYVSGNSVVQAMEYNKNAFLIAEWIKSHDVPVGCLFEQNPMSGEFDVLRLWVGISPYNLMWILAPGDVLVQVDAAEHGFATCSGSRFRNAYRKVT